jgi:ABC-2 type transport system permease protein
MPTLRIALMTIRLVMRSKIALFFTFFFPLVFLFVYAVLFARGNPEVVAYMFGPVVTLNIMGSGFWGLGMQSVMQRERGSLRRYRLAPIGPGTILASNLLANYLLELPTISLLLFSSLVFFHMPMRMGLSTLLILVTVGTFAFAGFGLTISSVANTMQEAQIYNNLVWITLLFLSGVTIPLPMLPGWIQRLAMFFPSTYLVSVFQASMLQTEPILSHWREMLVLIASGAFGLLFAMRLFRWEKEERISTRARLWAAGFVLPFLIMGTWMNTRANPTAGWGRSYGFLEQPSNSPLNPAEEPISIENFDGLQASSDLLSRWKITTNSGATGQSMAETSLLTPGADGTPHAMRLQGRLAPTLRNTGYVSAQYQVRVPPDPRELHGIEFQVRGKPCIDQVSFHPAGATVSSTPAISFVPGDSWQEVKLPISWLAGTSKNGPANGLWVLEILVNQPGDFTLDVDEIRYF